MERAQLQSWNDRLMSALEAITAVQTEVARELDNSQFDQQPLPLPSPAPQQPPVPAPSPTTSPIAWGAKVSATFKARVLWIADTLGIPANWIMTWIAFESARTFSPSVKNPGSSAVGLIQFLSSTAEKLGTTTAELAAMSAEDQLNYVYKYLRPWAGKIKSLGDGYLTILYPKAVGLPDTADVFVEGTSAYAANAALDTNKDHVVSKAEATARVGAMLIEGLKEGNAG